MRKATSKYRIVTYCPDRHIDYDGRTPYELGVGGGITARVHMAKALSEIGHDVVMVVNCRRHEIIDGVEYVPLDQVTQLDADVLIMNTSGGNLDLTPASELDVRAAIRIVWLHGTLEPKGLVELDYDYSYAVSNFVADTARREWSVAPKGLFVTYNTFEERLFAEAERIAEARDQHRLVYFSHPSKGFDTALEVVRLLREHDRAFHLDVFGGNRLWGGQEAPLADYDGVAFHGLTGRRALARALVQSTFSLQLQAREEPFGMTIIEALRAGCVVLASDVGAYAELIQSGVNGFLLSGDHRSPEVRRSASELILGLVQDEPAILQVRHNGMRTPFNTHRCAQTWQRHWAMVLRSDSEVTRSGLAECNRCGGTPTEFPDGARCMECGHYSPPTWRSAESTPVPHVMRH